MATKKNVSKSLFSHLPKYLVVEDVGSETAKNALSNIGCGVQAIFANDHVQIEDHMVWHQRRARGPYCERHADETIAQLEAADEFYARVQELEKVKP